MVSKRETIHILPSDESIEKVVLGTLLSDRKAFDEVRDILSNECFYNNFHQEIFKAILSLNNRGERSDLLSVPNELKKNGVEFNIADLAVLSSAYTYDLYQHSSNLNELAIRRKMWEIGQKMSIDSLDLTADIEDTTGEVTDNLSSLFNESVTTICSMKEAAKDLYNEYINKNLSGSSEITGSATGFDLFDKKSGGLQSGNLYIIAAETSNGKTSLAVKFLTSAASNGHKCSMYSLEMGKAEIFARMASSDTGISANAILYRQLNPDELKSVDVSIGKLSKLPIYFDDRSTSNIDTIISSIRSMKIKHNISGAVVDYLQILNVNMKGSNKEQQMGDVSRRLKNLAKDLGIWIIALSQLNRDNTNPIPTLNRLRDSGQISEAADVVMFIYRAELHNRDYPEPFKNAETKGTALIDVAKGRNIGVFKFLVGFDANTTKFYELINIPSKTTNNNLPF